MESAKQCFRWRSSSASPSGLSAVSRSGLGLVILHEPEFSRLSTPPSAKPLTTALRMPFEEVVLGICASRENHARKKF
jgi:hypothetical protein